MANNDDVCVCVGVDEMDSNNSFLRKRHTYERFSALNGTGYHIINTNGNELWFDAEYTDLKRLI